MGDGWKFGPRKVRRADEKVSRIGEVGGGNQNFRVLIDNKTKKHEWKADDLQRGGGAFQGGHRVMVCLGASYFGGVGRPYFVPKGQFIDQVFYLNVLNSHYVVEAARMFRGAGAQDFCFQQDGASAHTANAAQISCAALSPFFIAEKDWPGASPDLNALDCSFFGYVQKEVNEMNPETLLDLQLAIEQCVGNAPLGLVQKAIDGFYNRCKLCVDQEGRTFKHAMKSKLACKPSQRPADVLPQEPCEILDVPTDDFEGAEDCDECSD